MDKLTITSVCSLLVAVIANKDLELLNAANEGNMTLVTDALASGANPNWQRPGGSWPMATALIMASARNHADIALALLNAGADPNLPEYRGNSPLNEAAYHGSIDVVPILLSQGADIDLEGNDGQTPLIRTIHLNQVDMARVLLQHGADPNKKDIQGRTAASRARARGHYRLANLIDNFDTNTVSAVPTVSSSKLSSLTYLAVTTPTTSTIKLSSQIASQANKDLELFNAANEGNFPLVTKALASGANPNWQNPASNGRTALMKASRKNYAKIALALLNSNADPNLRDNGGNAPLHEAAFYGSFDAVHILLSHGADINGDGGNTPLIKAIAGHQLVMVRVLMQNGADPKKKGKDGRTAVEHARDRGFIELANFIDTFDTNAVTVEYTISTTKLSSPTAPPAQTSPITPSPQPSSVTSGQAHNLSQPIQITIACVAVVSMVVLMYLVVMGVKRHRFLRKDPHAVRFDNTEELNTYLYKKDDP